MCKRVEMKTLTAAALVFALLFSTVAVMQFFSVGIAYFGPIPEERKICIRSDGSVEPSTAPVSRKGNIYILTNNLLANDTYYYHSIEVQRDNVVLDGAGLKLQGSEVASTIMTTIGITLKDRNNVTIKNLEVEEYDIGIKISNTSNSIISESNITRATYGIQIENSSNYNFISKNNIFNNKICIQLISSNNNTLTENRIWLDENSLYSSSNNHGVDLFKSSGNLIVRNTISNYDALMIVKSSSNNKIYHNNFFNNSLLTQVYADYRGADYGEWDSSMTPSVNSWDNGYEGNYWSNYKRRYPNATQTGTSGIGNTPFYLEGKNLDRYPLMAPFDIENNTVVLLPPEPFPTTWILVGIITITVATIGLLVYFKKRHH